METKEKLKMIAEHYYAIAACERRIETGKSKKALHERELLALANSIPKDDALLYKEKLEFFTKR